MEEMFTTLGACQKKARHKCFNKSTEKLYSLQNIFIEVFKVVSNILDQICNDYRLMTTSDWGGPGLLILNGSGLPGVDNREKFESILSVFSLGLIPIKTLIFEGSYVQSCTLLRSSIEIMVQLREILDNKYKDKKTPKISGLDEKMRRIYSELTGLAHLSDSEFLSSVTKGNYDSGEALLTPLFRVLTPQFNEGLSNILFSIHIVSSIEIILLIDEYINANISGNKIKRDTIEKLKVQSLTIWNKI